MCVIERERVCVCVKEKIKGKRREKSIFVYVCTYVESGSIKG